MDAIKAIMTRRSIRKYKNEPVSEELVQKLLSAAMAAPTAKNLRPWHFVVIDERDILNEIPKIHPYSKMLLEAPMAIAVLWDSKLQEFEGYGVQDCSAAVENILIAAHAEGLGAVWLGIFPRRERVDGLKKLLNVPDGVTPIALIALGHPDEKKDAPDRFDKSRVHKNRW